MASKLKFTHKNFLDVLESNNLGSSFWDQLILNRNDEKLLNAILAAADIIDSVLDVPTGLDIAQFLLDYIKDDYDNAWFLYDTAATRKEEGSRPIIQVVSEYLDLVDWNKHPIVLQNLQNIISTIENKPKISADDFVKSLQMSGATIPVNGGNICSPKKYVANCPISLPGGFTAIEIRVNADSAAKYRVFGFLKNSNKTIYLLVADTKNSGQDKADLVFDSFMEKAKKFIVKHKLNENLLYNNIGGHFMENISVFDKLDEATKQQYYESYNLGWNDYFSNKKLAEATNDHAYTEGYLAAKSAEEHQEAVKYLKDREEELLSKLQKIRKTCN